KVVPQCVAHEVEFLQFIPGCGQHVPGERSTWRVTLLNDATIGILDPYAVWPALCTCPQGLSDLSRRAVATFRYLAPLRSRGRGGVLCGPRRRTTNWATRPCRPRATSPRASPPADTRANTAHPAAGRAISNPRLAPATSFATGYPDTPGSAAAPWAARMPAL